jgi:ABC-2 type transport system permease protein
MTTRPAYLRVLLTFARNSLVRDMTFRSNFLIETFTSIAWVSINLAFYVLIFHYTSQIGTQGGWGENQFFMFFATGLLVNSLVMTLFMTNLDELSELIRTGALDFALLKPIDAQFLVSLRRIDWSSLANFVVGLALLVYALVRSGSWPGATGLALYPFYVLCGVAVYYSFMVALAAASVWMGRNLTLLDFWFYITTFSRYPMEIYSGPVGGAMRWCFTFLLPVLIVVNVPARLVARPLWPEKPVDWFLPLFTLLATAASLAISRWIFQRALTSYRSASS